MSRTVARWRAVLAAAVASALVPVAGTAGGPASRADPTGRFEADRHPTDPDEGHLPPSSRNVSYVGSAHLTDVPWGIGDVAAYRNHAYLAAYAAECNNDSSFSQGGGVHVVDFTVPQLPVKVGFISAGANNYVGEGVQVLPISTPAFAGDMLLMSLEPCDWSKPARGGISLWDVTDPTKPVALAQGAGDRTPKPRNGHTAHSSHSAMAWDAGTKAYAVLVDNEEPLDVDILDITNPRRPRLIAETGLPYWRGARTVQSGLGLFPTSFHHDMWVKKIAGHWYILLSYWDTGWVLLNVDDPRRPRYVRSSEFPVPDPLTHLTPEGNAHQGAWSSDNRYVLGASEDFFAKFTLFLARYGVDTRFVRSRELPWAKPIAARVLNGKTIFGGTACLLSPLPPASRLGTRRSGEEAIVVLVEGECPISDKLRAAERAGYDAVVLAASHEASRFGVSPGHISCDEPSNGFKPKISVLCIGHRDFHQLFHTAAGYAMPAGEQPAVGRSGDRIEVRTFWDGGWGDVHLLDARTFRQIDSYAIREALNPGYGEGFGVLSVHEVDPDPRPGVNLGYFSYYSGGLRVLKFGPRGLTEVGHYVADGGSMFWGIHALKQGKDRPLLLLSDVNHGLWILRYTGPE